MQIKKQIKKTITDKDEILKILSTNPNNKKIMLHGAFISAPGACALTRVGGCPADEYYIIESDSYIYLCYGKIEDMKRKIFFIHIPKTAGNSVREGLRKHDLLANHDAGHMFGKKDAKRIPPHVYSNGILNNKKIHQSEYFRCYLKHHSYKQSQFSCAVIRNPFDLLLSYYNHEYVSEKKGWRESGWSNVNNVYDFKSFKEFITHYCTCESEEWHVPLLNKNLFGQLFDDRDRFKPKYLIYYENLNAGFNKLLKIAKPSKSYNYELKVLNSSNKNNRHYSGVYTDELRLMVEEKCKWELEKFGYEFNINPRYDLRETSDMKF